jgi:hypothetical protein
VAAFFRKDGYTVSTIGAGGKAGRPDRYPRKRDELWFQTAEKARAGLVHEASRPVVQIEPPRRRARKAPCSPACQVLTMTASPNVPDPAPRRPPMGPGHAPRPARRPRPPDPDPLDVVLAADPALAAWLWDLRIDHAAWAEAGRRAKGLAGDEEATCRKRQAARRGANAAWRGRCLAVAPRGPWAVLALPRADRFVRR